MEQEDIALGSHPIPMLPTPWAGMGGTIRTAGADWGWKGDLVALPLLNGGLPRAEGEVQATRRAKGVGMGPLGPQQLLDHVAGHAVEEQRQHQQPQQCQHDLDDEPLVAGADEVLNGLERVEEPHEGRVRPAAGRREGLIRQRAALGHTCHHPPTPLKLYVCGAQNQVCFQAPDLLFTKPCSPAGALMFSPLPGPEWLHVNAGGQAQAVSTVGH